MRIGVDLGGSKIEVVALDDSGREVFRQRSATPAGDYNAVIAAIVSLVSAAETAIGARASVGIGTPGALSLQTGLLKNSNTSCWNGKPLLQDLEHALARPVRLANDANCFTLSEAADGAAAGGAVVFGVIIGTGVGGGIAVHGALLTGPNAIAGEWGHNPQPWPTAEEYPGPQCYCGKQGCIETLLSGSGLSRDLEAINGQHLTATEIARAAAAGDSHCDQALARYEERLARALASVVNLIDPDVIVLGGGLSNIERLTYIVPKLWGRFVFSDTVRTRLVRAQHGDSSGVRGAAWLWSIVAQ